ncbi:hypothetical protein [uncultured Phenylobacterium sp.]|uniref:hypothetical protein n=1 Tax=uncultured Phenylobacterium sp. TaxID=349273 RepID=UPI0025E80E26|nr:hypothetical protein [uncultured Phenylobacterium sp.]
MSLQHVTERPRDLKAVRLRAGRVRRARSAKPAPQRRTQVDLWLPMTPLATILAPFMMLLAPLMLLAPRMWRMNPYETAFAVIRLLLSLGGTEIDVDTPDARVRIKIL